jgi:hypothetical protein
MKNPSRIGVAIAVLSIVFSLLCLAITPVFTAAIVLAAFFGVVSGAIAIALQARRTAYAAFVFAVLPLLEFLIFRLVE